jgi:hypothetical protein
LHRFRFGSWLDRSSSVDLDLTSRSVNQVLVRFLDSDGDHDRYTRSIIEGVQQDGTCWLSGTTWHGMSAMRISVSGWATTNNDVERSIQSILRAARDLRQP